MVKDNLYLTPSGKSIKVFNPDTGGFKLFRVNSLQNAVQRIFDESNRLTNLYHSTPRFPEYLGGDSRSPKFIREDVNILNDVLAGHGSAYSPEQVLEAAQHLKTTGASTHAIANEFYNAVASYYGEPDLSPQRTKEALEQKKFKTPPPTWETEDDSEREQARYEAYLEWLYKNIPNLNMAKVEFLRQSQLSDIEQQWNLYKKIDRAHTQRYKRTTQKNYKFKPLDK